MRTIGFVNGTIYESWRAVASVGALVVKGHRVAWTGEHSAMPSVDRLLTCEARHLVPVSPMRTVTSCVSQTLGSRSWSTRPTRM